MICIHKNEHGTELEQRPQGSGISSLTERGRFGLGRELSEKGGGGRRKYGEREKDEDSAGAKSTLKSFPCGRPKVFKSKIIISYFCNLF